jgi:uncharacterized membrane protein
MAGIGFALQDLFRDEGIFSRSNAIVKSIFVTSGPWLISIFTLTGMQLFWLGNDNLTLAGEFMSIVVYAFVFSMLFSQPVSTLLIRSASDFLYLNQDNKLRGIFTSGFLVIGIGSALLATLFLQIFTAEQYRILPLIWFFTSLSLLWFVMMVFVSCLKNFNQVSLAFFMGMLTSLIAVVYFSNSNVTKAIQYFTGGICLTLFWLCAIFFHEYKGSPKPDFSWIKAKHYYPLFFNGLMLAGILWADKLVYWYFSSHSNSVLKGFYFFPTYDFATFFANLSILPSTAFFVVFIETVFFKAIQKYFYYIEQGEDLLRLRQQEAKLLQLFLKSMFSLGLFQTLISSLFLLLIPALFDFHQYEVQILPLLKISVFNVGLQFLLQTLIIFLFYFNYQKEVAVISGITVLLSISLTYIFRDYGIITVGYPHFISLFVGLISGFMVAVYKIKNIGFYIFMENELT